MDNQVSCYDYGKMIGVYLDQTGKNTIETSFQDMMKAFGLPDDAVGRIALYSVPHYWTNYDAGEGLVTFKRHD